MNTIAIEGYEFNGPYTSTDNLYSQSGVYVILTCSTGQWTVIDVGEAGDVKERVGTHNRSDCWKRNNQGTLAVASYYVDETRRMMIEQFLRKKYNPVCGIR